MQSYITTLCPHAVIYNNLCPHAVIYKVYVVAVGLPHFQLFMLNLCRLQSKLPFELYCVQATTDLR